MHISFLHLISSSEEFPQCLLLQSADAQLVLLNTKLQHFKVNILDHKEPD